MFVVFAVIAAVVFTEIAISAMDGRAGGIANGDFGIFRVCYGYAISLAPVLKSTPDSS
jgi:hypothetical protein